MGDIKTLYTTVIQSIKRLGKASFTDRSVIQARKNNAHPMQRSVTRGVGTVRPPGLAQSGKLNLWPRAPLAEAFLTEQMSTAPLARTSARERAAANFSHSVCVESTPVQRRLQKSRRPLRALLAPSHQNNSPIAEVMKIHVGLLRLDPAKQPPAYKHVLQRVVIAMSRHGGWSSATWGAIKGCSDGTSSCKIDN